MRKTIVSIALSGVFGLTVLLAGCQNYSHIHSCNKEEKIRRFSRIAELNSRMLVSDLDTYLLLDKPSSLSHWHMPVRIR
jgi:hypothetical protein